MNKIVMTDSKGTNISLKDKTYSFLEDEKRILTFKEYEGDFTFVVEEGKEANVILLLENSKVSFRYKLGKNSYLSVSTLSLNTEGSIDISLEEKAHIDYYFSMINDQDVSIYTNIHHKASHTISNYVQHVVALKGSTVLKVDGVVPSSSKECICNQDNKIINLGTSICTILPNLLIDCFDVDATHQAFVGKFPNEEVFYLKARGIKEEDALRLLTKGFLLGKMPLSTEEKELFAPYMSKI